MLPVPGRGRREERKEPVPALKSGPPLLSPTKGQQGGQGVNSETRWVSPLEIYFFLFFFRRAISFLIRLNSRLLCPAMAVFSSARRIR